MCRGEAPVIIFHQGAFAADYQPSEFSLLGMAIKYVGLMGKEVRIIRTGQRLPRSSGLL